MATAYTSLLGLALPVTGELQGTWGTTVNDSITSLLDTAVAGTTTLSADTDVTLSTTTGAANQARQAILLCSGARTVLRTITAPAQSKIYTVINATTGGFSVKLVGVGPTTGVTIVAGESALVAWNGSDFIKISNTGGAASFTNVTVSGTTTLSGLTASTALALNGSKEVVSVTNTGTGNNVLSASPTLTGTISAAAATLSGNLTLSGGTANGVLYLDGSKVATSGSALVFDGTNLGIGTASPNALGLQVTKGSGVAAGLLLANAANNWSISCGASTNALIFTDNQFAERMRLDSTGNLGIGTSSPGAKLDVAGGVQANSVKVGTTQAIITSGMWYQSSSAQLKFSPPSGGFGWNNNANAAELMVLTDSGNLGIGTSSPDGPLQVSFSNAETSQFNAGAATLYLTNTNTTNNNWAQIFFTDSDGGAAAATFGAQYTDHANDYAALSFATRGASGLSERMRLDSSGNLGIGTNTINYRVVADCAGATNNDSGIAVRNEDNNGYGGSYNFEHKVTGGGSVVRASYISSEGGGGTSFLRFATTSASVLTEQMRLDASGNLGLGVTPSAWDTATFRTLQVGGGAGSVSLSGRTDGTKDLVLGSNIYYGTGDFRYVGTGVASMYRQDGASHAWFTAPSGTAGNAITFTQAMTLDASGNLGVGTTSPAFGAGSGLEIERAGIATLRLENSTAGNNFELYSDSLANGINLRGYNNAPMVFWTYNTECARITSGGYFKASNSGTYASSTSTTFEFYKDTNDGNEIMLITAAQATTSNQYGVGIRLAGDPNGVSQYFMQGRGNATERFTLRSNGGLANYQSNNVDLSDSRTKKDIAPAASMWSKIGALEIVTYKYNDQTHDDVNVGVIAQQVEQVEPVWVDSDGFGETPEDGVPLKTVYTKDITFAAIKALQEAMTRIEQLEARIAALEAQ